MSQPAAFLLLAVMLAPSMLAADPLPTIGISTVRQAIKGRRVLCFAVQPDSTLTTAVSVTLAYGGTAIHGTDYAAPTIVSLPIGLDTSHAIFVPLTATATATAGRTVVCTIQSSTAFDIEPTMASTNSTILEAFADSEVLAEGEPAAISVSATSTWTYDLHVHRPAQVPATVSALPVQPFTVTLDDAPAWVSVSALPVTSDSSVPFRITAVPPTDAGGTQVRFRLGIKVDADGDQRFVEPGAPTSDGQTSYDVYSTQSLVLAVRLAGAG